MLLSILLLTGTVFTSHAQTGKDGWMKKLNSEISVSYRYDMEKVARIDSLRDEMNTPGPLPFNDILHIFNEFSVFNFDSAYFYASRLQETAVKLNDTLLLKYARIKTGFVLLSSGLFKELFDLLENTDPNGLPNEWKSEYYILKARSYLDLAEYNKEKSFSDSYNRMAEKYMDSLLTVSAPGSFEYIYYEGLKHIRKGDVRTATRFFNQLLAKEDTLTMRQLAITYSTYSDIFIRKGQPDSAAIFLCRAAIADIRTSTKETAAILHLASLLFKRGDLRNASVFIRKALEDATSYGARQRILQLSNIMPLIEAEKMSAVESDKQNLVLYACIVTAFFLGFMILVFIIFKQVRRLKLQQKEIADKNLSLHHIVEEKEWLLTEIHHRVKNNLHTITSLLESQSAYLENEALEAIRNSQHRVFAMSLIHQKLYKAGKSATYIDIPSYLRELTDYLRESFESTRRIELRMDLAPLELDVSLAVPVGLILNEAITNAMKYAFPGNRSGIIDITLRQTGEKKFRFSVSDNGVGLEDGFDIAHTNSLGMKLMRGLSEDILSEFRIESRDGTSVSIELTTDKHPGQIKYST